MQRTVTRRIPRPARVLMMCKMIRFPWTCTPTCAGDDHAHSLCGRGLQGDVLLGNLCPTAFGVSESADGRSVTRREPPGASGGGAGSEGAACAPHGEPARLQEEQGDSRRLPETQARSEAPCAPGRGGGSTLSPGKCRCPVFIWSQLRL